MRTPKIGGEPTRAELADEALTMARVEAAALRSQVERLREALEALLLAVDAARLPVNHEVNLYAADARSALAETGGE